LVELVAEGAEAAAGNTTAGTCHVYATASSTPLRAPTTSAGLWWGPFMVYGLWFMVYGLWFMV
jgi:hypothetical protein